MAAERSPRFPGLGPLEGAVMDAMWGRQSATVREIHTALRARRAAYTTIMTTMHRLHRKGLLRRTREGSAYRYTTKLDRAAWLRKWAKEAIARLVPNLDAASTVYLVEEMRKTNPEVLGVLRRLTVHADAD